MSVYAGKRLCMAKYTLILESTEIRIGDVLRYRHGGTVAEKRSVGTLGKKQTDRDDVGWTCTRDIDMSKFKETHRK